ncbi:hypothetical protein O4002_07785 [Providencia stuartii]|nr:hypothetical protein [Providencia stuartii]WAZ84157.1 hypothetical protein O4002_07785 [Providencia stuartii]
MKKRKRLRDDNTQKCVNLLIQQDELEFTEKKKFLRDRGGAICTATL